MKELIRPLFLKNQFSIYKKFFAPQKPILDFHEVLRFSKTNFLFTRNSLHLKTDS